MHALNIDNVHKNFGAVEVLKGINLDLEEGGFLVLLGPSGCGKSTLLSLIAGLEDISAGSIRIGGNVANGVYPKDRDIAMVFQSYALYPSMTVDGNLGFGLKMRGVDKPTRETAVSQAAKLLNIGQLLRRKPGALSGGQRQRVAMGRAIVRDPKLFLFDEPLSNLDAKLRAKMRGEIKKLHQRLNASIVYVTHDQVEAMTLATKVAILNAGEVMQVGTPDEIYGDPDNLFVAGFVGSPPMNMLQAEVDETGRAVRITDTEKTLPLPTSLGTLARGRKVVLGIRPEWLTTRAKQNVASPISLTAPLEVLEPMGADTLALLTIGNDEVTARLGGRERPEVGKPIQLFANAEDLLVFDAESTRRVRAPSA